MDADTMAKKGKYAAKAKRDRKNRKRLQRVNPVLAPWNSWTWKFVPGLVIGFLFKGWIDWMGKGRAQHPPRVGMRQALAAAAEDDSEDDSEDEGFAGSMDAPTEELKMVLCVNDDLKMGKGKIAAQCAHAAVGTISNISRQGGQRILQYYNMCGQPKIAVRCPDLDTMMALEKKARSLGLPTYMVQDAGRTQIAAGSRTVLAVGPGPRSKMDEVTGQLKLL